MRTFYGKLNPKSKVYAWAFGAEVVSVIQEQAFDYLDGPVGRIAGAEAPIPYSQSLERAAIPRAETVIHAVESALGKTSKG